MIGPVVSKRSRGAACMALIVILALLIAPLCGRICAAGSGCVNSAAVAGSAETCHHAAAFDNSESEGPSITSVGLCNQHDIPAIVTAEQQPLSLLDASASALLVPRIQHPKRNDRDLTVKTSPPSAILPITNPVLRI